jgi:hypothetical protein
MSTVNVTVTAMLGIVLVFTRARERGTVAASRRTRERSGVSDGAWFADGDHALVNLGAGAFGVRRISRFRLTKQGARA